MLLALPIVLAGFFGLSFAIALLGAWPVMVALGILHTYMPQVPALGFLDVWALLFALQLVNPFTNRGGFVSAKES